MLPKKLSREYLRENRVSNLFETEKYVVRQAAQGECIIGEDGKYEDMDGYVVINRETGVIEHTTIMLPGAIFQCQHFNDTLESLMSPPEEGEDGVDLSSLNVPEDIVPN